MIMDFRQENSWSKSSRQMFALGSWLAFTAVGLGAFGAHGLQDYFKEHTALQPVYQTAVEYQFYHSLALLAAAWAAGNWQQRRACWAGRCFVFGISIFCGSLYLLCLTGMRWLGAITPIGGVAFMAGWLLLALSARHTTTTELNKS
ncbi:MAG: hypothetical protein HJJLKODD_01109 [Phycisphaerae bacterium]|nr:hypothetical protein [Phycisphaerae bacterium]